MTQGGYLDPLDKPVTPCSHKGLQHTPLASALHGVHNTPHERALPSNFSYHYAPVPVPLCALRFLSQHRERERNRHRHRHHRKRHQRTCLRTLCVCPLHTSFHCEYTTFKCNAMAGHYISVLTCILCTRVTQLGYLSSVAKSVLISLCAGLHARVHA